VSVSDAHPQALVERLQAEHRRMAVDAIEGDGAGAVIASEGDSLLALFDDARTALARALRLQRQAARWNFGRPEGEHLLIRAGLDSLRVEGAVPGADALAAILCRAGRLVDAAKGGELFVAGDAAADQPAEVDLLPLEWREITVTGAPAWAVRAG